jgi:LysM repeat protein
MNRRKHGFALAALLLIAVMLSACTQSVSNVPQNTPTVIGTGLFVSPFPSEGNPMALIEEFAKGTATAAAAQTQAAGGTPGTPSSTVGTPATALSGTPSTPTNSIAATTAVVIVTQTTPIVTPGGPTPTQAPKPASYTLQKGEFPYCIARRFNVNPDELLTINGLSNGQIYYPNLSLKIPQTGNPFPADRSWHDHPSTYTVSSSDQTVSGVACYYGDIDPAAIAAANGISVGAALTSGQTLTIP